MVQRLCTAILVSALVLVVSGVPGGAGGQVAPAAGVLDPTFGCAAPPCPGFNSFDLGIYTAVTVAPDGTILAAGGTDASLIIDRWGTNGVLDTSFGNDMGRANLVGNGAFTDVAVSADGRIIGGGSLDSGGGDEFALFGLDASGALDPTFGTGGSTLGPDGMARDLAFQADGKIVLAGFQEPTGPFVVARYDADGNPDLSFGGGTGFVTGPGGAAFAVAIQSDGKIVVGGVADVPDGMLRVARYDTDGNLDPTFGTGGVVTGPGGPSLAGSSDRDFTDLVIQPDGKILVASNDGSDPVTPNFRVVRYLTNGDLDPTFGSGGIVTGPAGLVNGNGIALMPDGRIIVGGATSEAGAPSMFRVVRYDASGVLDPDFGCTAPPCPGFGDAVPSAIGTSATLQPDLKIVMVGTQLDEFGENIPVVARFDNSEPVAPILLEPTFTG
jgi:uncharacterized delta-60 repeat protein